MAITLKDIQLDPSVIIDLTARAIEYERKRGGPAITEYDVTSVAYSILHSEVIKYLEPRVLPGFNEALVMYRLFNGEAKQGEWAEGLARAFEPIAEFYGDLIDSPHEVAELIASGNCNVLKQGSPYNIAVTLAPRILEAEGGVLYARDILAKAGAPLSTLLRAVGVKSESELVAADRKEYEEAARAAEEKKEEALRVSEAKRKAAALIKQEEAKREEAKKTVEELVNFVVDDLSIPARGFLNLFLEGGETFSEKQGFLAHNLDGVKGFTQRHEVALSEATKIDGGARLWVAEKILNKLSHEDKAAEALSDFFESEGAPLATVLENSERPDSPPVKQKRTKGGKALTPDTIAVSLIRNSSGITDGELCELIAVARPTLAKYTKGLASITLTQDAKDKLLEVIGRNIRELQEAEKILQGDKEETVSDFA